MIFLTRVAERAFFFPLGFPIATAGDTRRGRGGLGTALLPPEEDDDCYLYLTD